MHKISTLFIGLVLSGFACTNNTYIYEVNEVTVEPNNAGKDNEKRPEQYLNILYANLYQEPLSPNELVRLNDVITSIGDKQVAYETVVAKMMADPKVKIPSREDMLQDIEQFIRDTYKRFYVREPSQSEIAWFKNYIESRPNLTPELIYYSFATSDEYNFY